MLALLAAALGGAAVGAAAGLVPGLHPNTLAVLALGAVPALAGDAALAAAVGLVAMALAHQFTALVPGSFLGAPAPDDALRALPAQELVREGRAHEAVQLAVRGAALGVGVAFLLVPLLHVLLGDGAERYVWLQPAVPVVLLGIAALLLGTETAEVPWRRAFEAEAFQEPGQLRLDARLLARKGTLLRCARHGRQLWLHDPLGLLDGAPVGATLVARGRWRRVAGRGSRALGILAAALVFVLAAALGLVAQALPTPSPFGLPASPMFPLLTGLFGAPALVLALSAPPLPRQQERPALMPGRRAWFAGAAGSAAGALVGLLPGMSSSAASVLAFVAVPQRDREGSLVVLSAAGAGAAVITSAAFVLVQRARSGAMLAVAELVPAEPWRGWAPPSLLAALLLGCAAGALVGYGATLAAGRAAARVVHRVPYARLSAAVLALLVALVGLCTGLAGLALLAVATGVGLLPWRWGLRKGHLIGCTMGPLLMGGFGG